jgi:hypothetical protein
MFKKVVNKEGLKQQQCLERFHSLQQERPGFNLVQVTILESSGRVGGRIRTYYGHGWYGDLGAMVGKVTSFVNG